MHLGWKWSISSSQQSSNRRGSYQIRNSLPLIAYNCLGLNIIMGLEPWWWCWLLLLTGRSPEELVTWSVLHNDSARCTQASQTLITQANNINLSVATDQIFTAPSPCVCLAATFNPLLLWELLNSWPWVSVIFGLVASDPGLEIARIPPAHEKSIKTRVLIEILTTNDRGECG